VLIPQIGGQAEIRDNTARILKFCEIPKTRSEIMEFLNLTHREMNIDEKLRQLAAKPKQCVTNTV